jgi:single-strand DNA-binding protein
MNVATKAHIVAMRARRCVNISMKEKAMAGSVNKVTLVGNLGRDPEIRTTQDGQKIVNLSLATNETWTDRRSGERKERVEWHRVVIFNEHLGDVAEKFLRKGRKVFVEGSLRTRKWSDQGGQDHYTTEVVIGRFKGELVVPDKAESEPVPQQPASATVPAGRELDDEIPF